MIKSLTIENFKAFDKTPEIKLGKISLLTGINGRGKSSLLQVLLLLSQSVRKQNSLQYLLTNGDWVNLGDFSEIINKSCRAEEAPVVLQFTTDSEKDNDFRLSYKYNSEKEFGELVSMIVNQHETFSEFSGYNDDAMPKENTIVSVPLFSGYTGLMNLKQLYYISAERICAQNEETEDRLTDTYRLDRQGRNILNIIYRQGNEFQEKIEKHLSSIFDGATFHITKEDNALHLYMDSLDNGNHFLPVNVGYGYGYVLLLLTAGLLAQKNEIIIVENPEAHLHPSAQAALMRFFISEVMSRDVQIIMETHSDHIVNASLIAVRQEKIQNEDVKILFFSRNEEKRVLIQNLEITKKGRIKNHPVSFCDQYAMDMHALMGF